MLSAGTGMLSFLIRPLVTQQAGEIKAETKKQNINICQQKERSNNKDNNICDPLREMLSDVDNFKD